MPIATLLDNREHGLAPLLSQWPLRMLPVGDIWIGLSGEDIAPGGIVAERKSIDDFEASIKDGRYREQRTRLTAYCQERGARPLYILEGLMDRLWGGLGQETLEKYRNRLLLRYGIAVIHTDSLEETARICRLLATQMEAEPAVFVATNAAGLSYSSTVSVTKKGNREDPRNFALCTLQGCPGVSAAVAEAILTACGGTLEGVMAAQEETIAAANTSGSAKKPRKVGPTVAKRLVGLLHAASAAAAAAAATKAPESSEPN